MLPIEFGIPILTFAKTGDGNKYPVHLLIDNYSRSLLAYDVQEKVMGKITSKLIETAYQKSGGYF